MLSDEDKARIRAEEEFRAQARAEAEAGNLPSGGRPPAAPDTGKTPPLLRERPAALLLTVAAAGALSYLFFSAVGGSLRPVSTGSGGQPGNPFGIGRGTVRYAVTVRASDPRASCGADVTISRGVGETSQLSDVRSGWERSVEARAGEFLYLAAQARCSGTVGVAIYKNGQLYKQAEATGERAVAQTSGTY
jgi:hypothetical protein